MKIILVAASLHYLSRFLRFLYYFHKIPGEWYNWRYQFLGFALSVSGASMSQRVKVINSIVQQYPYNVKIAFVHMFMVLMNDVDTIQKIYSSTSLKAVEKPYFYKFFGYGDGLITAKTTSWKPHRKILNNAFGLINLQTFVPIFDQVNKRFVKRLRDKVGRGKFDIREYAAKCTMESICSTSFALDVEAEGDNLKIFNDQLKRADELAAFRTYNAHLHPEFLYRRSKYWQEDVDTHNYLNTFADKLVKTRRHIIQNVVKDENNNNEEAVEDLSGARKPNIFVDHLIKSGQTDGGLVFSDKQIVDHAVTILLAGNETTSLTISISLLYLAMHPECQDKAYMEIKEVMGDSKEVTFEKLRQMQYCEMVLKETLRLCPAVAMIAREITGDIDLDGVFFPKGTYVLICLPTLHRHPKYWGKNCNNFDPDNFLPENVAKRPAFCYMPFSAGIRNCLGTKYAMLSLKVMLVNLLMAFKFTTHLKMEELRYKADIMFSIKNGYWIEIQER